MKYVHKKIILIYIMYKDEILMRESTHQDYQVIDVFAFKIENDFDNQQEITQKIDSKLYDLFNNRFPYFYKGIIHSTINKVGLVAHITAQMYVVQLNKKYTILPTYVDDVVKDSGSLIWIHKDSIASEKRLREGDKKVLYDIFQPNAFEITMVENQGEQWINAKLILYKKKLIHHK